MSGKKRAVDRGGRAAAKAPSFQLDPTEKINAYRALFHILDGAKEEKDWSLNEGKCGDYTFPDKESAGTYHALWKTFFRGPVQLVRSEAALAKLIIHAGNGVPWDKILQKVVASDRAVRADVGQKAIQGDTVQPDWAKMISEMTEDTDDDDVASMSSAATGGGGGVHHGGKRETMDREEAAVDEVIAADSAGSQKMSSALAKASIITEKGNGEISLAAEFLKNAPDAVARMLGEYQKRQTDMQKEIHLRDLQMSREETALAKQEAERASEARRREEELRLATERTASEQQTAAAMQHSQQLQQIHQSGAAAIESVRSQALVTAQQAEDFRKQSSDQVADLHRQIAVEKGAHAETKKQMQLALYNGQQQINQIQTEGSQRILEQAGQVTAVEAASLGKERELTSQMDALGQR